MIYSALIHKSNQKINSNQNQHCEHVRCAYRIESADYHPIEIIVGINIGEAEALDDFFVAHCIYFKVAYICV